MVAKYPNEEITLVRLIVYYTMPVVEIPCTFAIYDDDSTETATSETPPSISPAIVIIALNSSHDFVLWTRVMERLIQNSDIARPMAPR